MLDEDALLEEDGLREGALVEEGGLQEGDALVEEDGFEEGGALVEEDGLQEGALVEEDGVKDDTLVEGDALEEEAWSDGDALEEEGVSVEEDGLEEEDALSDGDAASEGTNPFTVDAREQFGDMVGELHERGCDADTEMREHGIVLKIRRSEFSELALQGLCWSSSDGDIRVHVAAWKDTGSHTAIGMPRVRFDAKTSRVSLQIRKILDAWLEREAAAWDAQTVRDKTLFLWRLERHLFEKVRRLPYLCMHCLRERESAHPRWRPSACADGICKLWVREMTGDTLSIIFIAPRVVELELALFAEACKCRESRRKLLFVLRTHHLSDFLAGSAQEGAEDGPDWQSLQATIEKMPQLSELEPQNLESALCAKDPLLFKLVRWILNSSAGFLVQVQDAEFLASVDIREVFLFLPDDHAKLVKFDALKAGSGMSVTYAFHGSGNYNWSSILRDGLVVASHTPLMSTGASGGSGIYLGKDFATSLSYCGNVGTGLSPGSSWRCMGLCEIAHTTAEDRGYFFVVEEPARVLLRALLVFDKCKISCMMSAAAMGRALESLALYRELHALGDSTSTGVAQE